MGTPTPSSTPGKEAQPSPIFGPCLLWPNGWMDQDATWHGGKPRPRRLCVRLGPSSPLEKGTAHIHLFSAHVYSGQMDGWMKSPLGVEVDLGPGNNVLDGDPAPPAKGAQQPPLSGRCLLWPRSPISAIAELLYKRSSEK